ncbi:MAG: hypothetical protein ACT4OO_10510 [Nitrospiraceae bacterium]
MLNIGMFLIVVVTWIHWPFQAMADKPIYSYMDEKGNLVATDRLEDVPEQYRSRVRVSNDVTQNRPDGRRLDTLALPSSSQVETWLRRIVAALPATVIPGLTAFQSVMFVGGCLAALVFAVLGKLTGGPVFRLLMPWAIGLCALSTLYLMFVSDLGDRVATTSDSFPAGGSVLNQFRKKATTIEEDQKRRMDQLAPQASSEHSGR